MTGAIFFESKQGRRAILATVVVVIPRVKATCIRRFARATSRSTPTRPTTASSTPRGCSRRGHMPRWLNFRVTQPEASALRCARPRGAGQLRRSPSSPEGDHHLPGATQVRFQQFDVDEMTVEWGVALSMMEHLVPTGRACTGRSVPGDAQRPQIQSTRHGRWLVARAAMPRSALVRRRRGTRTNESAPAHRRSSPTSPCSLAQSS